MNVIYKILKNNILFPVLFCVTVSAPIYADTVKVTALGSHSGELSRAKGYSVFGANSGKDAFEVLKVEKIDLVFSDIVMTEMTGYE